MLPHIFYRILLWEKISTENFLDNNPMKIEEEADKKY